MSDYAARTPAPANARYRAAGRAVAAVSALALSAALIAHYGWHRDLLVPLFAANVLVAISVHDLERRIIPNRLVLLGWAGSLAGNIALAPGHALEWVLASFLAAAFFFAFARLSRGGMGMGDVKLAAFLGAALGDQLLPALLIGTGASAVLAAGILLRHGAAGRNRTYPLGPFLAGGAIVMLLFS